MRLIVCFALFLPVLLVSGTAHALRVEEVRLGVHGDQTRVVMEMDQSADFRAFVMDNPIRLVVDMPPFTWAAQPAQKVRGAAVQAIRHGALNNGMGRIVFDLKGPSVIQNAFLIAGQGGQSDRLVLDIAPASRAAFVAQIGKFHGTLGGGQGAADVSPSSPTASVPGAEDMSVVSPSPLPNIATIRKGAPPVPPQKPVQEQKAAAAPLPKPLVIIDPGHGGVDPGAISPTGIREKDVTLALAKELRRQLMDTGRYRVMLTRDTDVFIKLADRVKFARQNSGDLFVSLHADSINQSDVTGVSIYTLSEKASDAQTAKLAARENRADLIAGLDLEVADDDVANILVDLAMRDTMNQSKFFANEVVDTLGSKGVSLLDPAHRFAGFAVLKAPDIPSVLVEAGFMSNKKEARLLNTPEHRRRIAESLRKGIDIYFEQVRKNQRT